MSAGMGALEGVDIQGDLICGIVAVRNNDRGTVPGSVKYLDLNIFKGAGKIICCGGHLDQRENCAV